MSYINVLPPIQIDIEQKNVLDAEIDSIKILEVDLGQTNIVVKKSEDVEAYTGSYQIVPQSTSQTIQCKDQKMTDNVTILSIPYYESSNVKGTTVYIGGQ